LPYLAVVALPPLCAAATIYVLAGRSPTLPAPTVLIDNTPEPPVHVGIRTTAE
jgi:hypothetical protein